MFRRSLMVLALPGVLLAGCAQGVQTGAPPAQVLDKTAVQGSVSTVLRDHYKLDFESLSCPDDQSTKVGTTFDCSVLVGGNPQHVTVTVTGGDGKFDVSLPH